MSKDIKITKIPMVVSIVMLLLGIFGGLPIGFYQLLRLVICGAAIYIVYVSYNLKKTAWCWIMGFVALIFNPLFQLHLGRDLWVVMDFVTLLLFIIAIFAIGVSEKKKLKINKKLIKRILIIIGSIVVLIFLIKWGFYYYDITVEYPKRLVEDEYSPSQWVGSLEGDITIYGWMVNRVWTKPNTYLVSYVYAIAKDRKESKTRGWWWEVNTKEKIVKYAMGDVGLRERYGLSLSSEASNIKQISREEFPGEGVIIGEMSYMDGHSIIVKTYNGAKKFWIVDNETILWKDVGDIRLSDISVGDTLEVGYYTDQNGNRVASWADVIR